MAPMHVRVKVLRYFCGLIIVTNNFAFEVKATLCLENTQLENWVAKIGLNDPHDY